MSSSKDTQSSSGSKPKEPQPPRIRVRNIDELRQPPVDKQTSKPQSSQFGSNQNLGQMNDSKKKWYQN